MRKPDRPATPAVLDAFKWSATYGSWEGHRTQGNTLPAIAAALAQARSRSAASSPP